MSTPLGAWISARRAVGTRDALEGWLVDLAGIEHALCVRVAVASASAVIDLWEQAEPAEPSARKRIDAALAWIDCPCREHAERAAALAYELCDDDSLSFALQVVLPDGRAIQGGPGLFAHLSADAASVIPILAREPRRAAEEARLGAVRAIEALRLAGASEAESVARIVDAMVLAVEPFAKDTGAIVSPGTATERRPWGGEPLSDIAALGRRLGALLAALGVTAPKLSPLPNVAKPADAPADKRRTYLWAAEGIEVTLTYASENVPMSGWEREWRATFRIDGVPVTVTIASQAPDGAGATIEVTGPPVEARVAADALETASRTRA